MKVKGLSSNVMSELFSRCCLLYLLAHPPFSLVIAAASPFPRGLIRRDTSCRSHVAMSTRSTTIAAMRWPHPLSPLLPPPCPSYFFACPTNTSLLCHGSSYRPCCCPGRRYSLRLLLCLPPISVERNVPSVALWRPRWPVVL